MALSANAERFLASLPMRLLARRFRLSPSPYGRVLPRGFILLSNPRSGTNLLLHSLEAHSEIAIFNEIFNEAECYTGKHGHRSERWLRAIRNRHPYEFYNQFVQRSYAPPINACIFKLFYPHSIDSRFQNAVDAVLADERIRFIYLKRPNKLAQLLSRLRAKQTGEYLVQGTTEPSNVSFAPLIIDIETCDAEFPRLNQIDLAIESRSGDRPTLAITYGDLTSDFEATMYQVQRFLEIGQMPLVPTLVKQRKGTLRESIANYDALSEHYAGTEYAHYFDPDWREQ